jgi:DNA-binding phage protein
MADSAFEQYLGRKCITEIKTRPFDAANYLETKEDVAEYLRFAREANDPQLLNAVLNDIARALSNGKLKARTRQSLS